MSARKVTLNRRQRLYVIAEGNGHTCLGFDVCERLARHLAAELGREIPDTVKPGTLAFWRLWQDLLAAGSEKSRTGWRSAAQYTKEQIEKRQRCRALKVWEKRVLELANNALRP